MSATEASPKSTAPSAPWDVYSHTSLSEVPFATLSSKRQGRSPAAGGGLTLPQSLGNKPSGAPSGAAVVNKFATLVRWGDDNASESSSSSASESNEKPVVQTAALNKAKEAGKKKKAGGGMKSPNAFFGKREKRAKQEKAQQQQQQASATAA